jgi:hypothetical protein
MDQAAELGPGRMIARIARWIRAAPGGVRWTLALLGAAAILNLLVLALNHYSRVPSGPAGSSFSTVPEGVAAYSDLLGRTGHPVSRLTDKGALDRMSGSQTLVIVGAAYLTATQIGALDSFVRGGGTLIVGVTGPEPWVSRLVPDGPTWKTTSLGPVKPESELPQTAGVHEVVTAGAGAWGDTRGSVGVVGSKGGSLIAVAGLGNGSVELISDPSFLSNALLASADNAALALDLAGPDGRPVAFLETIHGFGEATGYGAIPVQWKLALVVLAAAALLLLVAKGRRLGSPEEQESAPYPARVEYVNSLGLTLSRTKDPRGALRPLGDGLRLAVRRRARLEALVKAGAQLGLDEAETRVLREGVNDSSDGITAAKALARLGKGEA